MEGSGSLRDTLSDLYTGCRCGKGEAFERLRELASSSSPFCSSSTSSSSSFLISSEEEDLLVARGYLGDLYLICDNAFIPQDRKKGFALLEDIAKLDKSSITCYHLQHLLGVYYQDCCDDSEQAIPMFRLAAEQGHAMSISTLGYFHDYGIGMKTNHTKAFAFYQQAAELGYPVAMCNVGKCYDSGTGCEVDPKQAGEYFIKAAELGYVDAQFNLGVFYQLGRGVALDYFEAFRWFLKAANQGDGHSQYNLAWCYSNGVGVEGSNEEAFKWALLAAEKKDEIALRFVGSSYQVGRGVKKNVVEAVRYYRRGSALGDAVAKNHLLALKEAYKEGVWNNRKPFVCFLWGCGFIYRPGLIEPSAAGKEYSIVEDTFYIHDIRYEIMSFL